MQVIERKLGNRNSPSVLIFIVRIAQNDTRYSTRSLGEQQKVKNDALKFLMVGIDDKVYKIALHPALTQHSVKTDYLCSFSHITRKIKTCTKLVTLVQSFKHFKHVISCCHMICCAIVSALLQQTYQTKSAQGCAWKSS